jgi:hypothetical protein
MTVNQKVRKALDRQYTIRKDPEPGVLGDGNGNIVVPGTRYDCYVRVSSRKIPIVVRNMRVPHLNNLKVWVGRDELTGDSEQVLGFRVSENYEPPENPAVGPHRESHGPSGSDPVSITTSQIINGLVYASTGMTIKVNAGWVMVNGVFVKMQATSMNLSGDIPVTGACYALVRVDEDGLVDVVTGTPVASLVDLSDADIPANEDGYVPLALVKLYAGQTALSKISTSPDVIDIRYAPRIGGGSGTAAGIAVDTTNFDGNLSVADDTVQKALETIDEMVVSGTDANAIHDNVSGEIAAITQKVTPVAADKILIEDSEDTNAKKYITAGSIVNQAAGAADPSFYVDGYLAVGTNVGGVYIAPRTLGIQAVYIYCKTPGTAGSTIVDINKNGTTIFTTQANRPTLAYDDANGWAKGTPDVTALVEGDILTIDIDQIATGAVSLVVVIAFASYGGANTFLALSDTPASYSGQALKALRVNAGEDAIEFYVPTPNLIGEVVSNASAVYLEITSIPGTYKNLVIDFIARSSKAAVTNDLAYIFLNGDTTDANYRRQIYSNTTLNGAGDNSFIGTIPGANALANNFAHYRLIIPNYASTLSDHAVFVDGLERRAATEHYKWWGYVFWENTAAITSVRIGVAADNLVSGSILRVWGEI